MLLCILSLTLLACQQEPLISEGFVISKGDSIYYKTVGEGTPLVIIHGGPVLDHQYLLDHFEPLFQNTRLIFYDQRACGKSQLDIDPDDMTFEAMLSDIEELRIHFGLDSIAILGHSWGGLVAMKYAIEHNDKLDKLILSNSMAPSANDWDAENIELSKRFTKADNDRRNKLASSGLLRTQNASPYIEQFMLVTYKYQFYDTTKLSRLKLYLPNDYPLRSAAFTPIGVELNDYNLYKDLSKITKQVLIIYGESEPAVSSYLGRFDTAFARAEVIVIPQSGHFPFIEQPATYFKAIKTFTQ